MGVSGRGNCTRSLDAGVKLSGCAMPGEAVQSKRAHPSSKRTWSLPLPVAPCETASAPTCLAISIWRFAMSGRAMEVPSRYTPSYSAFALQACNRKPHHF